MSYKPNNTQGMAFFDFLLVALAEREKSSLIGLCLCFLLFYFRYLIFKESSKLKLHIRLNTLY